MKGLVEIPGLHRPRPNPEATLHWLFRGERLERRFAWYRSVLPLRFVFFHPPTRN